MCLAFSHVHHNNKEKQDIFFFLFQYRLCWISFCNDFSVVFLILNCWGLHLCNIYLLIHSQLVCSVVMRMLKGRCCSCALFSSTSFSNHTLLCRENSLSAEETNRGIGFFYVLQFVISRMAYLKEHWKMLIWYCLPHFLLYFPWPLFSNWWDCTSALIQ